MNVNGSARRSGQRPGNGGLLRLGKAGASFRNDAQNHQCSVESTPEQTGSPALSVQRTHGLTEFSKKPRTPSQPLIVGFSRYVGLSSTHRSVHPEAENFLGRDRKSVV